MILRSLVLLFACNFTFASSSIRYEPINGDDSDDYSHDDHSSLCPVRPHSVAERALNNSDIMYVVSQYLDVPQASLARLNRTGRVTLLHKYPFRYFVIARFGIPELLLDSHGNDSDLAWFYQKWTKLLNKDEFILQLSKDIINMNRFPSNRIQLLQYVFRVVKESPSLLIAFHKLLKEYFNRLPRDNLHVFFELILEFPEYFVEHNTIIMICIKNEFFASLPSYPKHALFLKKILSLDRIPYYKKTEIILGSILVGIPEEIFIGHYCKDAECFKEVFIEQCNETYRGIESYGIIATAHYESNLKNLARVRQSNLLDSEEFEYLLLLNEVRFGSQSEEALTEKIVPDRFGLYELKYLARAAMYSNKSDIFWHVNLLHLAILYRDQ